MSVALSAERLSDIVGLIYDCVVAPERWNETVEAIRSTFGFALGTLGMHAIPSGEARLQVVAGMDAGAYAASSQPYAADLAHLWGGVERILQFPLGEPVTLSQAVPPEVLAGNRYYTEWGLPRGLVDITFVGISRDDRHLSSLALGRHVSAGTVSEDELAGLRLIAPHIRRAVLISDIFDMKALEAASFGAVLESLLVGVVLVDEALGVVHVNAAAARQIEGGGPLGVRQGQVRLSSDRTTAALRAAVTLAARDRLQLGQRGIGLPARDRDDAPSVVHVLPLNRLQLRSGRLQRAVAALFVVPATAPPQWPRDALMVLYNLTPAETRVFELICEGETQASIARRLGIAPSTVKTHLLRVLEKTGCSRQAELLRLSASLSLPI